MTTKAAEFTKTKETKNAVQYHEVAGESQEIIGALYIKKSTFDGDKIPETISVRIDFK